MIRVTDYLEMTIAVDSDIKPQSNNNEFELEHDKTSKMTCVSIDQSLQGTHTIILAAHFLFQYKIVTHGTD